MEKGTVWVDMDTFIDLVETKQRLKSALVYIESTDYPSSKEIKAILQGSAACTKE